MDDEAIGEKVQEIRDDLMEFIWSYELPNQVDTNLEIAVDYLNNALEEVGWIDGVE